MERQIEFVWNDSRMSHSSNDEIESICVGNCPVSRLATVIGKAWCERSGVDEGMDDARPCIESSYINEVLQGSPVAQPELGSLQLDCWWLSVAKQGNDIGITKNACRRCESR